MWSREPDEPPRRPRTPHVWAVLLLTLAVRGTVVYLQAEDLRGDPDGYRNYAQTLAETGTFGYRPDPQDDPTPSAYRPPLYPLLLADLLWLCQTDRQAQLAIGATHVVLGVLTVALVIAVGTRLGLGGASLMAGGLLACDPILLHQSTLVMTETLATFLAAASLYFLVRALQLDSSWDYCLAGGTLALAALCRPTFLVMLGLVGMVIAIASMAIRARWGRALGYAVAAAIVLAPWTIRNLIQFRRPIVATTHGGFTFHLANNASFYAFARSGAFGATWQGADRMAMPPQPTTPGPPAELERDRAHYLYGREAISADPAGFVLATFIRSGRLWQLIPHQIDSNESSTGRWLRYAIGGWYTAVFLLALVGIAKLGGQVVNSPWLWGLLLCLSFTLVHAFYWSNMRMRAPLMPAVCLLAAVSFAPRSAGVSARKSSVVENIRLLPAPGTQLDDRSTAHL